MRFRYRFVQYGTTFVSATGSRGVDNAHHAPHLLHENEVALDVGGRCIGCDDSSLNVIDHHFFSQKERLPSAACAVVHHGPELLQRFAGASHDTVWLVGHRDADFDAFSAMFLVRWLLTEQPSAKYWDEIGIRASGFDWYEARAAFAKGDATDEAVRSLRWAVLLASYSAHIDNARRIVVRRERALHSVFYAALLRGRAFAAPDDGACELFQQARHEIEAGRDPLFDMVLEPGGAFAPEFALLESESAAYERDLRHARRAIVYVPNAGRPFEEWYEEVAAEPLLDETGAIQEPHLAGVDTGQRRAMDGIYLRDPECLLFKEWARADVDGSSMHRGFTFTFVVYSRERPGAERNTGSYYIALDPNDAGHCHLYTVWARLQAAEVAAIGTPAADGADQRQARTGFEGRAGERAASFDDPWFDASNYACTLVATPGRGTLIGKGGTASDCTDDPIFEVVREELERWAYDPPEITYHDRSAACDGPLARPDRTVKVRELKTIEPADSSCFRFAYVRLQEYADLASPAFTLQVAEMLWRALHPKARSIAADTLRTHLFRFGGVLGVWSRAGIALAYTSDAEASVKKLQGLFDEVARCACLTDELIKAEKSAAQAARIAGGSRANTIGKRVELGENVLRSLAETWHKLALPEGRVLSNFVDEIGLARVAEALRDLTTATKTAEQNAQLAEQNARIDEHMTVVADVQTKVEWLELLFVGIYATEIGHVISEYAFDEAYRLLATLVVAATLTLPAMAFLQPWKHRGKADEPRHDAFGIVLVVAFAGVILVGLILGGLIAFSAVPEAWKPVIKW